MIRRPDNLPRQGPEANPVKFSLAWFRREEWDRLLDVSDDRDDLEETFDEWVQVAQQQCEELGRLGYDVEKVDVDVEELVRWCLAQGTPVNGKARANFALRKVRKST